LPKDHLVFFLRDVLEKVDLSPITSVYEREERGYPPYHPKMLTGVLLYGYATGVWSSRKLEKRCQEDVAFRVLAANNGPDHRTISDFRKRHLDSLPHLFSEILTLCQKAGLVKFGHIALDGTKVKANASKHKAMSYGRMKHEQSRLEQEIASMLKEAERTDKREDRKYGQDKRGDELPAELAHRETRLAKIQAAKQALEEEAKRQKKDDNDRPASGPPMAKIKTVKEGKTGKEIPVDRAQRNFTDPDSRIMPYQKTFIQAYNAQVAVDSAHQIIVATEVSNSPTDEPQLKYMVSHLPRKPKVFSADAGYANKKNIAYLKKRKIDAYIACGRESHGVTDDPFPRGRIPKGLTLQDRMQRKVRTIKGRKLYARRKAIVEPAIGQIKHAMGFRQFSLRGHHKVRAEWFLVSAVHNLRKLFNACLQKPGRRQLALAT
jgi:transposase